MASLINAFRGFFRLGEAPHDPNREDTCPICLTSAASRVALCCSQIYCPSCITTIQRDPVQNGKCPLCRTHLEWVNACDLPASNEFHVAVDRIQQAIGKTQHQRKLPTPAERAVRIQNLARNLIRTATHPNRIEPAKIEDRRIRDLENQRDAIIAENDHLKSEMNSQRTRFVYLWVTAAAAFLSYEYCRYHS